MIQHKCDDEKTKRMLYDVTFEAITAIMEMMMVIPPSAAISMILSTQLPENI